jgi:hypothetical protein
MSRIVMSLSPNYVPSWGIWEVIREVSQNFLDAEDEGYKGEVSFNKNSNTLTLYNAGYIMSPAEIAMLGETSKASGCHRGLYGEGCKIAALVTARLHGDFTITSGDTKYSAHIEFAEEFGKPALVFHVRKLPSKHVNGVKVEIRGISYQDWETHRQRILQLRDNPIEDTGSKAMLLTDVKDKGNIFMKGMYVCNDKTLRYGYNFIDGTLDRDRRVMNDWDITSRTSSVIYQAYKDGIVSVTELFASMQEGAKDTRSIQWDLKKEDVEKLYEEWTRIYGLNAVPVQTSEERDAIGHFGMNGVICNDTIRSAFDKIEKTYDKALVAARFASIRTVDRDELSEEQKNNFSVITKLLIDAGIGFDSSSITFCIFTDEGLRGLNDRGCIKIAQKCLDSKKTLLDVLVEEIAHVAGRDGSMEHKCKLHEIYTAIVSKALNW